jgi:Replication protein
MAELAPNEHVAPENAHLRAFRASQRLAGIYEKHGYEGRASKVRACGKAYSFYVCHECGEFCYLAEFRCDDRLCALCGRARVARLLESYGGVLNEIKQPKMVTISMRSRPLGELAAAVKELWASFSRLRHRSIWKSVAGAVVSLEITFNRTERTWHPHLHVLVDADFIVWQRLRDAWGEVTLGEGTSVYIQRCRPGWQRELIKYVTKVKDLYDDFQALKEFLGFAKGRRFVRTYGQLYNCAVSNEETAGSVHCRGCGAVMVLEKQQVKINWLIQEGGYFAYAKGAEATSQASFSVT